MSDDDSGPRANPLAIDPDLKRGPYVQMGATDSMLIVWQTSTATQGVLEYGLDESVVTRIDTGEILTEHSILLTGLAPNTSYFYRVLDGERLLSELLAFRTNPGPNDTNFTFIVLGDSGFPGLALSNVAGLVNTSQADLGLHTGDVVYLDGAENLYDISFFFPFAEFLASSVLYPSLGNHDLHTNEGAPYLSNFHLPTNNQQLTERYYSFDYANAHFVALDTNQPTAPGSAQRAWLEQDLAATTKPWKFVFFHHPPYSGGFQIANGVRSDLEHTRIRRDFVPLFELYGVDIVFAGHAHSYERMFPIQLNQVVNGDQEPNYVDPLGPIYIVTGGGGGELTELGLSEFNAAGTSAYHIVEISVSGNELTGRAIASFGTVLDEFSLVVGQP